MSDIHIRTDGHAGRITLNRPKALNALSYAMCLEIDAALLAWRDDAAVRLVILDAAGDKAFCAGGDIAELYATGTRGDFAYGQKFWRDEYRMNALIADYPKPVVSLMQGFVMGGGVGVGCHGSLRIVGESSRIAMPECGIGLVPDVGGSALLMRAPGKIGAYLGLTGARMDAGDAVLAGFADAYVPQARWDEITGDLCQTGDLTAVDSHRAPAPEAALAGLRDGIDAAFGEARLSEVVAALEAGESDFATATLSALRRNCPLSMACTLEILRRLPPGASVREAVALEYRFTHRAMTHGDLLEGIRAVIIDKDRSPRWSHALDGVPDRDVAAMLEPVAEGAHLFEREDRT